MKRLALILFAGIALGAAVPEPASHFGFTPGDDYKLADYGQLIGYYKKLAAASDRIRLERFGTTSEGRPMYVAVISAPENLRRLEAIRQAARRLALGEATAEEARTLAAGGKAIVWIDSGLHASEVAPAQQAPLLTWKMITGETPELRAIRENVILLQVPCINPDGLEAIAAWYRKNVGTPYELAPLPRLYQKYAGHDNNRDWFMMNLRETREVTRLLYHHWFPQVLYNQHQAPPFPARIFVPPYAEPLNPSIPAAVMEGINTFGSAIKERLAREQKPGVLSYLAYDAWWNGGMRSAPAFHNIHGILTETAAFFYATPKVFKASELPERFTNGNPTTAPTVFYERPWLGGRWALRDAVEYMLTVDMAILAQASTHREELLNKAWEMARANIEAGRKEKPFAWVVPAAGNDGAVARQMLGRLAMAGIAVQRSTAPFTAGGATYPTGTYVLPAGQPFRAYLFDLMEPQRYPELRAGQTGPTKRPYDIAGWTLPMQMGVKVDRLEEPFQAALETVSDLPEPGGRLAWTPPASAKKAPRVAVYEPWVANMDAGWTEWVLDAHGIPYTALHNEEMRRGGLEERFDVVVMASQTAQSILHGVKAGEGTARGAGPRSQPESNSMQRPEYTGGIAIEGLAQLAQFVKAGGTLVLLDQATELASLFPLGVRAVEPAGYFCPGSLLRIDVDTTEPVGAGMPAQAIAFSSGGPAWEITSLPEYEARAREVRVIARYARQNLLASGWVSGEKAVLGKPAAVEVKHGEGRLILFGFRPQHRGQTFGTFRMLLNALYR